MKRIIRIKIHDLGFRLGVAFFGRWVVNIPFPIPIFRWKTIRYSLKHQGLYKSFSNYFWVPSGYKELHNLHQESSIGCNDSPYNIYYKSLNE